MLCSNCKKQIDKNQKFCPYCGTKAPDYTILVLIVIFIIPWLIYLLIK